MLRLLRIRNFAIIDELELDFHQGFNVITGETGAGKSIILDALGLILGERANAELIRQGFDEATVEAMFDITQNEAIFGKLRGQGLVGAEAELVVRRTVHRNGKNKIFVNGELVTLSQLGEICESLVDLCSQHEHQSLTKSPYQLELLDKYGGIMAKRRELRELFSALRSHEAEITATLGGDRDRSRTESFLQFQFNEINEFSPQPSEEETLQIERRRLQSSTQLLESANHILALLEENQLGKVKQKLSRILEIDPTLAPTFEMFERACLEIDEVVSQLNSYASDINIEPSRLEEVEERLTKWGELKRKYGTSYDEVIETRARIERELSEYAHLEERIKQLEASVEGLKKEYLALATELSKKRKNIGRTLAKTIEKEIEELAMLGARFSIEFENGEWTSEGIDHIQLTFSPNPGEGLKPLGRVASGGELSRVMLAIRRTIAGHGGIGVYVFDEIDSGVGGKTATIVGRKIRSVSEYNQVICITHLAQVAAFADRHFSVTKRTSAGRTVSSIGQLDSKARILEIARMLGGLEVTDKSRAHAKELLQSALSTAQK